MKRLNIKDIRSHLWRCRVRNQQLSNKSIRKNWKRWTRIM